MSDENDKKTKGLNPLGPDNDEDDSGSETGTSGQGGKIEFRDFLASGQNLRDDLLPFDERKRLLSVHQDTHELRVKQQKEKRQQYKNLKEGKLPLREFRDNRMGSGVTSQFKANPILADKAQFSGIDRQVTPLANENVADTNEADRDRLTDELQYRLTNQPTPKFNPKPHGPGY